jgi:exodeoxyribonuclease VII large subunit
MTQRGPTDDAPAPQRAGGAAAARPTVRSVSSLTFDLKAHLEGAFRGVSVEGEVISARRPGSGHVYFQLRDSGAQLRCVIWRSTAARLPLRLRDGMQIVATGDIEVYPPRGDYQLIVRQVAEAGLGDLLARREELRRRLAAEGLFDPTRKRPLPRVPRAVGVVTAARGAALRDILTTIAGRLPTRVVVSPCLVQGQGAAASIAAALARLVARRCVAGDDGVDVVIIGRGGGAVEDLWAFNEEIVVRAVAACPIPIISAVGHEIDEVLTDLAADVRAPTPTAAGELVVPRRAELEAELARLREHAERAVASALGQAQQRLDELLARADAAVTRGLGARRERQRHAAARLRGLHPRVRLAAARDHLGALELRLRGAARALLLARARRLAQARRTLGVLSPTASLERGYAIVRTQDGRVVRRARDVAQGAMVDVILHHGQLTATVTETRATHGFEPEDA